MWLPTPEAMVDADARGRPDRRPRDVVYDLGAGEGRIPIAAAREFGARGGRHRVRPGARGARPAQRAARRRGRPGGRSSRATSSGRISPRATVVTLYLLPELNQQLRPRLLAAEAGHARRLAPLGHGRVGARRDDPRGRQRGLPVDRAGRGRRPLDAARRGRLRRRRRRARASSSSASAAPSRCAAGRSRCSAPTSQGDAVGFTFVHHDGGVRSVRARVDGATRPARWLCRTLRRSPAASMTGRPPPTLSAIDDLDAAMTPRTPPNDLSTTQRRRSTAAVAVIELSRPGKANALDLPMWQELRAAMRWLDETPAARVGILRGAGALFTSGIDLALLAGLREQIADPCEGRAREKLRRVILDLQDTLTAIDRCRKPVIAAMHGALHRRRRRHRARLRHALLLGRRRVLGEGGRRRAHRRSRHAAAAAAADRRRHGPRARLHRTQRRRRARRASSGSSTAATTRRRSWRPAWASSPRRSRPRSPLAVRGCKEMITYARDHSLADGLNHVATWNAAMLLSADLPEALAAARERRAPEPSRLTAPMPTRRAPPSSSSPRRWRSPAPRPRPTASWRSSMQQARRRRRQRAAAARNTSEPAISPAARACRRSTRRSRRTRPATAPRPCRTWPRSRRDAARANLAFNLTGAQEYGTRIAKSGEAAVDALRRCATR